MTRLAPARVRAWDLWTLPGRALAFVLAVHLVTLTAACAALAAGRGDARGRDVGLEVVVGAGAAVLTEVHNSLGRRIEQFVNNSGHVVVPNLDGAWLAAFALLASPSAVVPVFAGWLVVRCAPARQRDRSLFKAAFNASGETFDALVLCVVANVVVRAHGPVMASLSRDPAWRVAVVGATAAVLLFVTEARAGVVVFLASGQRYRDLKQFDPFPNLANAGITVLIAVAWTTSPAFLVLVVPLIATMSVGATFGNATQAITRDPKTRLLNAAGWRDRAAAAMEKAEHTGAHVGVLMVDLDHFKRVNDTWGHVAGDAVLASVADVLRRTVRGRDEVGRFGGEEFVVLLPGADDAGAAIAAERIRAAVAAASVLLDDGTVVRVTTSVGVASGTGGETVDAVLERADKGVYTAKESGRDAVRVGGAAATVLADT